MKILWWNIFPDFKNKPFRLLEQKEVAGKFAWRNIVSLYFSALKQSGDRHYIGNRAVFTTHFFVA